MRGFAISGLCMFGALLISSKLAVAPAIADPAYKSSSIADFFVKASAGAARDICFGTAAECPTRVSGAAAKFDLLINFEFDSDQLTAAAKENLNEFAKALNDPRLKGHKFEIDGHTDATGTEPYNFGLSERRAASVVAYLAAQGLDSKMVTAKGFGMSQPRVSDPYSAENRRVETHLL
jgi:OmpA-OmpF porin, OOP family